MHKVFVGYRSLESICYCLNFLSYSKKNKVYDSICICVLVTDNTIFNGFNSQIIIWHLQMLLLLQRVIQEQL